MRHDEDRESAIEKIRKLLAMTERAGCTQAEAVQAALMAQKLIVEHGVKEGELEDEAELGSVESVVSALRERTPAWGWSLASTVAGAFRCKLHRRKERGGTYRKPVFYGHARDALAAKCVYERLSAVCDRLAADARRRERARSLELYLSRGWHEAWCRRYAGQDAAEAYKSFAIGFTSGVAGELERQSAALMVAVPKDVLEAEARLELKKGRPQRSMCATRAEDYSAGQDAGRDAVRSGRMGSGEDGSFALTSG